MKKKIRFNNKLKKILSGNPLKIACVIGLVLTVIISVVLLFNISGRAGEAPSISTGRRGNFQRELRSYDLNAWPGRIVNGEKPAQIERQLSRLHRQARSIEDQLSALKRHRELALIDRQYLASYQKAAQSAAEAYNYSAPIAAVASEAMVIGGYVLSAEDRNLLRKYVLRISQTRFDSLELSVHILAGNMDSPLQAVEIQGLERLISSVPLPPEARRDLQINEFLLRAAKGDVPGATQKLNTLLSETGMEENLVRMGAEFFYDHHSPYRAGELFSRLSGDKDMERAADALVLAGEISGARNIWFALASPDNFRSLYNLAASSATPAEELSWLEQLLRGDIRENIQRIYSIIRYTRLKEASQSIAILEEQKTVPMLDLELLRRRLETLPPTRATAEVWMLINRNRQEEALYEWAAWYFDHQKIYGETARLLKEAERSGISANWIQLHKGLALSREGKINESEKIFNEALAESEGKQIIDWRLYANLGRINENRRAVSAALAQYEAAAAIAAAEGPRGKPDRALLQMRISRCLEALGRSREAERAMEYALELDPDNLIIRRELRRLEGR